MPEYSGCADVQVLLSRVGLELCIAQELAAPIRALTGLQCLRLSLHTHSGNWSWLRQLHRLTDLHLSTHGMLALCTC
jgi:hypothetical protein